MKPTSKRSLCNIYRISHDTVCGAFSYCKH